LGRQFDDWVVVLAPKMVPEPLKSPKIAQSIQPNLTQPNPNPKCPKTGLGLGSKSGDLTQPDPNPIKSRVGFGHAFLAQTQPVYILNLEGTYKQPCSSRPLLKKNKVLFYLFFFYYFFTSM
jgi:hypothetical protein